MLIDYTKALLDNLKLTFFPEFSRLEYESCFMSLRVIIRVC